MRIKVDHTTVYDYSAPAHGIIQLLRLTPGGGEHQHIRRWRVDVDVDGALRAGTDPFGNLTQIFTADGAVRRMTLHVAGEVDTRDAAGVVRGFPEPLPFEVFRRTTALTQPDAAITAFARGIVGATPLDRLHALNGAINDHMAFDADATGTGTDAATAFSQARGVCQDYAQIFCSAARLLGSPARYVSGHFVRLDDVHAQPAGHAWVEALVDDLGWVGFDPTNGISVTAAHVRVAVGLDYLDAAPVRGARRGGGSETLTVSVSAADIAPQSQSQSQG